MPRHFIIGSLVRRLVPIEGEDLGKVVGTKLVGWLPGKGAIIHLSVIFGDTKYIIPQSQVEFVI